MTGGTVTWGAGTETAGGRTGEPFTGGGVGTEGTLTLGVETDGTLTVGVRTLGVPTDGVLTDGTLTRGVLTDGAPAVRAAEPTVPGTDDTVSASLAGAAAAPSAMIDTAMITPGRRSVVAKAAMALAMCLRTVPVISVVL